jgi:hypothetical protein
MRHVDHTPAGSQHCLGRVARSVGSYGCPIRAVVQPVAFAALQRSIGYFGAAGVSGHRLAQQTRVSVFSGGFSFPPTRGPTPIAPGGSGRLHRLSTLFIEYSGVVVTGVVTNTHVVNTVVLVFNATIGTAVAASSRLNRDVGG